MTLRTRVGMLCSLSFCSVAGGPLCAQDDAVTPAVHTMPRYSLYSSEGEAEVIVDLPTDLDLEGLMVTVSVGDASVSVPASNRRLLVPVPIADLPDGATAVGVQLFEGEEVLGSAQSVLRKAPEKPGAVRIDNLSRGLESDGLPVFPFGFYSYWPVDRVLDEEVVRGFNLLSPYQGGPHSEEDLARIRAYLDRAADIGMRVNYQIMWAYGTDLTDDDVARLQVEVEMFCDHPALLAWYTADEPAVETAGSLERVYNIIKELDPYHPVSIVFYQGAEHARLFENALDIVMVDPYPIPNLPMLMVSDMSEAVGAAFGWRKPLWVVPQCFGGHEWWRREPTAREQRVMTYLALIHGATGIQYFVRDPLVSFPKSPTMWAECGALALETAELAPAILSPETPPEVTTATPGVHARAFAHRGLTYILAVNTENAPGALSLRLVGSDVTGEAQVVFEERTVPVVEGAVSDIIDAYGTRAYAVRTGDEPADDLEVAAGNLTVDPSFEDNCSVGTPAACYVSIPDGATAFLDSRVARHGRHSLRLIAPSDTEAPSLSPFPFAVEEGKRYRVSIWAKAATDGVRLRLACMPVGDQEFALTTEWAEYVIEGEAPSSVGRAGLRIALASKGVAWADLFQAVVVE